MRTVKTSLLQYFHLAREQKKLLHHVLLPISFIFVSLYFSITGIFITALGSRAQSLPLESSLQNDIAEQLVRLHVIANSDSDFDQELKLQVKNEIVEYLQTFLSGSISKADTMYRLNENIDAIEAKANELLDSLGISYQAHVTLGIASFPVKVYGDITLPAGNYDALRIELGRAEGKNWWCIIFPNLCYVDATYQVVPEDSKAQLKYLLTEEEYDAITTSEHDTRVVVKFKLWEWIKSLFS